MIRKWSSPKRSRRLPNLCASAVVNRRSSSPQTCIKHLGTPTRCGFFWNLLSKTIIKGFLDRTNKVHDVKQLQNKYALLKKDWQSWSKLMDSRHGPTGISYNEATGLIQASDDWWAYYEKVDKNAIKFKTKPLEHMDLMRRVYEGATATEKYAWTPGAAFEPVAPDDGTSLAPEEDYEDSSELPPFQPTAQHEHTVHHTVAQEDGTLAIVHAASSGINADDTPTSGMNKRKLPGPTHPQRKKRQSEGASLLASSIENLASSVKLQQRQICISHDYADSAQQLIEKCITRLYSLEGLDPQDPLVPYAQSILDNPANQAIMMSIPTDAAVIALVLISIKLYFGFVF
ncbi:unnamed protein product [Camellia sinensis]